MNETRCRNCGATVAGRYCGDCGQRVQPLIVPVWQLAREAAEDFVNADSRLWRTLGALLFRPGFLTREYFDGRRARYLPPVRLYLVVSLLCFLLVSLPGGGDPAAVSESEAPVQLDAKACNFVYDGPWGQQLEPHLRAACLKIVGDNGRELSRRFAASLPGALFIALPLLALFMKILYWRPRRYYVEHLLFLVHTHSFQFTVVGLATALDLFPGGSVATWLTIPAAVYACWYPYRAMRNVYGQQRWLTLLKFAALAVAYLVAGVILLILTLFYNVVALSLDAGV